MDLSWIIFAIGFSVFQGLSYLVAEYYPGRMLNLLFWIRLLTFLILLPVVFILPWPEDPVFYVAVTACSVLFACADLILYGLTQKNGAGVVARVEPLSSWVLFFLWAAVAPSLLWNYLQNPLQLAGLIFSLTACVYFTLRLRHCTITWSVIKEILPAILLGVFATVLSKTAMIHSELHSGVWFYSMIQAFIMSLFYSVLFTFRSLPMLGALDIPKGDLPDKILSGRVLLYGLIGMVGLITAQVTKYYAITLAENPAYVTVFVLLTPIWIMWAYRVVGKREEVDVVSGLGIVTSTLFLVIFTQF
jgi:hypothetical protein